MQISFQYIILNTEKQSGFSGSQVSPKAKPRCIRQSRRVPWERPAAKGYFPSQKTREAGSGTGRVGPHSSTCPGASTPPSPVTPLLLHFLLCTCSLQTCDNLWEVLGRADLLLGPLTWVCIWGPHSAGMGQVTSPGACFLTWELRVTTPAPSKAAVTVPSATI